MAAKTDAAGRRVKTKGEAPKANLVDKDITTTMQRYTDWISEQTGYAVDARSVQLAGTMRGEFQKSDANQSALAQSKVDRENELQAREERKAARIAAREEREAERAQKAEERSAAKEARAAAKAAEPKAAPAKKTAAKPAAPKAPAKAVRKPVAKAAAATPAKTTRRRPAAKPAAEETDF